MESRVELFARIRRDARVRGLSIRALAREDRVSRRTVPYRTKALTCGFAATEFEVSRIPRPQNCPVKVH
jgi:hypothetical protein